jgi:hypothetical protein
MTYFGPRPNERTKILRRNDDLKNTRHKSIADRHHDVSRFFNPRSAPRWTGFCHNAKTLSSVCRMRQPPPLRDYATSAIVLRHWVRASGVITRRGLLNSHCPQRLAALLKEVERRSANHAVVAKLVDRQQWSIVQIRGHSVAPFALKGHAGLFRLSSHVTNQIGVSVAREKQCILR